MKRLILSFFITLALYLLLLLLLRFDLQTPPKPIPPNHRFNISNLRLLKKAPPQLKPKKIVKKVVKKAPPKKQILQKKVVPKRVLQKIKKRLKVLQKRVKKMNMPKLTKKEGNTTSQSTPSLAQLFAKKSPKAPSNHLPPQIKKLYKDEFESFTKEQQHFIKKNLSKIGEITQKYLYLRGYPYIAVKTRQEGVNIVEFYLHPNGDISHLRIIKSSGYEALDKNSLETIKTAYKDYPLPSQRTKIRIYVRYRILY